MVDHIILTKAAQEMEIPLTIVRDGRIINDMTNPDKLFTARQDYGYRVDILTKKVKSWKKVAFLTAIATGYLLVKNHDLKSQLKKQQRDFESVDLFDVDLEENDI